MTSHGQQWSAIERGRKAGIVYLILGLAYLVLWSFARAVSADEGMPWWTLFLGLAWLGSGTFELVRYRRRMAAFTKQGELDAEMQMDDLSH